MAIWHGKSLRPGNRGRGTAEMMGREEGMQEGAVRCVRSVTGKTLLQHQMVQMVV